MTPAVIRHAHATMLVQRKLRSKGNRSSYSGVKNAGIVPIQLSRVIKKVDSERKKNECGFEETLIGADYVRISGMLAAARVRRSPTMIRLVTYEPRDADQTQIGLQDAEAE